MHFETSPQHTAGSTQAGSRGCASSRDSAVCPWASPFPSGCQSPRLWDEGDSESLSGAAPFPAGMEAPATHKGGPFPTPPYPVMPF